MAYSTKADVKYRLSIDQSETAYDTELDDCIAEADAWIDNKLKKHVSVPVSPVPDPVKYASADRAAGIYWLRKKPETETNAYLQKAEKGLNEYIQETYHTGELVD